MSVIRRQDGPTGKRRQVLELSDAQKKYRRAAHTDAQRAYKRLATASTALGTSVGDFRGFDVRGIPEDWLADVAVRIAEFVLALVNFQRHVNAVVAGDPYFTAVRERQNLERIELHQALSAGAVLEDALRLSERASVESISVVRRMIHALNDPAVNLEDVEAVREGEGGPAVVKNDSAHGSDASGDCPCRQRNEGGEK